MCWHHVILHDHYVLSIVLKTPFQEVGVVQDYMCTCRCDGKGGSKQVKESGVRRNRREEKDHLHIENDMVGAVCVCVCVVMVYITSN